MLPNESEAVTQARACLAYEFDAMAKELEAAVTIKETLPGDTGPYPDFANRNVANTVRSLLVSLCRKFRSVQLLCECAQASNAESLVRSMFEVEAWIHFILIDGL